MLRRIFAVSLLSVSTLAAADALDVNLSNSAAQFKFSVPSGVAGKSDLFASFMYNDTSSQMAEGGLLVMNEEGSIPGLSVGIGAKAVVASFSKIAPTRKTASGIALGAQARFEIPADRRFAVVGDYHYAPKIISFGDLNHFFQAGLRAEYAISPLTQAYVGYRVTKFMMNNALPNGEMDNGLHIGVRLSF